MKEVETNSEGMNLMTKIERVKEILINENITVIVDSKMENSNSRREKKI